MGPDGEFQKKVARHFALSSVLGRFADDLSQIEQLIIDDLFFFKEWMETSKISGSPGIHTELGAPSEATLKILESARNLIAAHKQLMAIGEMVMNGTEDTGKYKM